MRDWRQCGPAKSASFAFARVLLDPDCPPSFLLRLGLLREELDETVDWTDGAVWRSGAAEAAAAAAAAARQKGGGGTPLPPPEDVCELTSYSEEKLGSAAAAAAAEPPELSCGTPPPPPLDEEAGGGPEDEPSPPEPAQLPYSAVSDLRRQLDQARGCALKRRDPCRLYNTSAADPP